MLASGKTRSHRASTRRTSHVYRFQWRHLAFGDASPDPRIKYRANKYRFRCERAAAAALCIQMRQAVKPDTELMQSTYFTSHFFARASGVGLDGEKATGPPSVNLMPRRKGTRTRVFIREKMNIIWTFVNLLR